MDTQIVPVARSRRHDFALFLQVHIRSA